MYQQFFDFTNPRTETVYYPRVGNPRPILTLGCINSFISLMSHRKLEPDGKLFQNFISQWGKEGLERNKYNDTVSLGKS